MNTSKEITGSSQNLCLKSSRFAISLDLFNFVQEFKIRSVRSYKNVLRKHHQQGLFLDLPIEAKKHYQKSWSQLLHQGQKYCSFEQAAIFCRNNSVWSKSDFDKIPSDQKAAQKLPQKMNQYLEFKGWADFRKSAAPNQERLRGFLVANNITSIAAYCEFQQSDLGKTLRLPKNPRLFYARQWRGWEAVLAPVCKIITIEERQRIMQIRGQKMTERRRQTLAA